MLREITGLLLAFTLGAGICEIHNQRMILEIDNEHQAQILHNERAYNFDLSACKQELADLRVDVEINYFDGYRWGQANGVATTAPACRGIGCSIGKLPLARQVLNK